MTLLTKIAALTAFATLVVPTAFGQTPAKPKASTSPKIVHKTVAKKATPKVKKPVGNKAAVKKASAKKP